MQLLNLNRSDPVGGGVAKKRDYAFDVFSRIPENENSLRFYLYFLPHYRWSSPNSSGQWVLAANRFDHITAYVSVQNIWELHDNTKWHERCGSDEPHNANIRILVTQRLSECTDCVAGKFAASGFTSCTLCPVNTYSEVTGARDLSSCCL